MRTTTVLVSMSVVAAFGAAASAGDVKAKVKSGSLLLDATGAVDGVGFAVVGLVGGDVKVVTLTGTTVNGIDTPAPFGAITQDVRIALGPGADVLTVSGTISRDVRVDAGDGLDTLMIQDAAVGRHLTVDTGRGFSGASVHTVTIGGDLRVRLGDQLAPTASAEIKFVSIGGKLALVTGDDPASITIDNVAAERRSSVKVGGGSSNILFHATQWTDDLSISTRGDSTVELTQNNFTEDLVVRGAGARSAATLQLLQINGDLRVASRATQSFWTLNGGIDRGDVRVDLASKSLTDGVLQNTSIDGNVRVRTGRGADSVRISLATIDGNLDVGCGPAADAVSMNDNTIGARARIALGAGDDRLRADSIGTASFQRLAVDAGSGDDFVGSISAIIAGKATIDLGSGDNNSLFALASFDDDFKMTAGGGNDDVDLSAATFLAAKVVQLGGGTNVLK